jgi:hypothetical protein
MISRDALVGMRVRVRESLLRSELCGKKGKIMGRWGPQTTWPWTCSWTTATRSCSGTTSWRRSMSQPSNEAAPRGWRGRSTTRGSGRMLCPPPGPHLVDASADGRARRQGPPAGRRRGLGRLVRRPSQSPFPRLVRSTAYGWCCPGCGSARLSSSDTAHRHVGDVGVWPWCKNEDTHPGRSGRKQYFKFSLEEARGIGIQGRREESVQLTAQNSCASPKFARKVSKTTHLGNRTGESPRLGRTR